MDKNKKGKIWDRILSSFTNSSGNKLNCPSQSALGNTEQLNLEMLEPRVLLNVGTFRFTGYFDFEGGVAQAEPETSYQIDVLMADVEAFE